MPGEGLDRPRIVVLGAPIFEDVIRQRPAQGENGALIRGLIGERDDVGYTHAVQCYAGKVETSDEKERFETARRVCRERVLRETTGRDVLALGNEACHSVLGRPVKITGYRGTAAEHPGGGRVLASYHPAYVARAGGLASTAGHLLRRDVDQWLRPQKLREATFLIDPKSVELPPKGTPVVLDIETTGLDPRTPGSSIRCYGFSWFSGEVPVVAVFSEVERHVRMLLSGRYPLVAQNYAFEVKWLLEKCNPLPPSDWHDTMLMGHCAHEDRGPGKYNLESLVADYLPAGFPTKKELLGEYDVLSAPLDVLMPYCAWDCLKELMLFERFRGEVYGEDHGCHERPTAQRAPSDRGSRSIPQDVVQPASLGATRLERVAMPAALFLDRVRDRGLLVSRAQLDREIGRIDGVIAETDAILQAAYPCNWSSDAQVRTAFLHLKLKPSGLRTEAGEHALHELARAGIRARNPERADLIDAYDRYKHATHERSNFLGPKGLKAYLDESPDGRLHPYFNLTGTRTFRLSATAPAIQTFEESRRRCIVAEKGHVLLEADYDGAEVAWAAFLSRDPWYMSLVMEGRSMHTDLADFIVQKYGLVLTKEQYNDLRRACKAINFGIQYGGGINAIEAVVDRDVGWKRFQRHELEAFIRDRKSRAPRFEEWSRERFEEARKTGGVLSVFGAFMRIPGVEGSREVLAEARRQAANSPIQRAASDATLVRAIELGALGFDIWTITHDSILFQVKKSAVKKAAREIRRVMEAPRFYWGEMPWLRVSFKVGESWGGCHALES